MLSSSQMSREGAIFYVGDPIEVTFNRARIRIVPVENCDNTEWFIFPRQTLLKSMPGILFALPLEVVRCEY